jgi:hypothetical protein
MGVKLCIPVTLFLLLAAMEVCAQDLQRGLRNYRELMAGRVRLEQLSPQEQQEVLLVYRRVSAASSDSGESSDCRDARVRAEAAATELAGRARKLASCADSQNFDDDCSTESRRVRSAHGDYESASYSVRSECG